MKRHVSDSGLANKYHIPLGKDYHALPYDVVQRIIDAADEYGYRKPKNANGSRARYFYAYLNRSRH